MSEVVPGMHAANPEQLVIYSRVAATGRPEQFETYVKPLNIWFSVSVYSHEAGHFIAVFDNITARKKSEATLADAARRLQLATEVTGTGVWDWDLRGQHIWTVFPEARGTIFQEKYEAAVRDNVVAQFETFYPPFGVWFEARAFPSSQGLAVYFRDITDQQRARSAARGGGGFPHHGEQHLAARLDGRRAGFDLLVQRPLVRLLRHDPRGDAGLGLAEGPSSRSRRGGGGKNHPLLSDRRSVG